MAFTVLAFSILSSSPCSVVLCSARSSGIPFFLASHTYGLPSLSAALPDAGHPVPLLRIPCGSPSPVCLLAPLVVLHVVALGKGVGDKHCLPLLLLSSPACPCLCLGLVLLTLSWVGLNTRSTRFPACSIRTGRCYAGCSLSSGAALRRACLSNRIRASSLWFCAPCAGRPSVFVLSSSDGTVDHSSRALSLCSFSVAVVRHGLCSGRSYFLTSLFSFPLRR